MTEDNVTKKNKSFCKNCHDRNYLIQCACGYCNEILFRRDSNRRLRKYIRGHNSKFEGNNMWICGRFFHESSGYWYLSGMYDHPNSDKKGIIAEHIYNFTIFNKCCMLPWGVVHHIDENPENNMPWNLMGMMRSDHIKLHKIKDMSGRRCVKCGSDITFQWYGNEKDGLRCRKCYMKKWWDEHKSEINRNRRIKRIVTNS